MTKKSEEHQFYATCQLRTQLFHEQSGEGQHRDYINFILWPGRNYFLQRGLMEEYMHYSNFMLFNSFLFVDFSITNIRYFLEQECFDHLSAADMKIIIISDKILMPLANYYIKKCDGIDSIIYADSNSIDIKHRFERIFSGRSANVRRGGTLNEAEFSLLKLLLSGSGFKKIHKTEKLNMNNIYTHKSRLEKKMGCSMNKIFAMIASPQE
ncbi:hypothetical protein GBE07_004599 [Escherichia coli]|nr:hypothetical protein [Escherichia coli]